MLVQAECKLPEVFIRFMVSPELNIRIRSYTECYLKLPEYVVRTSYPKQGTLIHFLSDQQWCLHWYLWIGAYGNERVFVSPDAFGFRGFDAEDKDKTPGSSSRALDLRDADIWLCSPSFHAFIYRYWLENEISFALTEDVPLTVEQQRYIAHYGEARQEAVCPE